MPNWFSKWEYQFVLNGVCTHPYLIITVEIVILFFFSNLAVEIILWALFMNFIWFPQEHESYFQYTSEIHTKQPFWPLPSLFSGSVCSSLCAQCLGYHGCTRIDILYRSLLLTPLQKHLSKLLFVSSPCIINPKVTMN